MNYSPAIDRVIAIDTPSFKFGFLRQLGRCAMNGYTPMERVSSGNDARMVSTTGFYPPLRVSWFSLFEPHQKGNATSAFSNGGRGQCAEDLGVTQWEKRWIWSDDILFSRAGISSIEVQLLNFLHAPSLLSLSYSEDKQRNAPNALLNQLA